MGVQGYIYAHTNRYRKQVSLNNHQTLSHSRINHHTKTSPKYSHYSISHHEIILTSFFLIIMNNFNESHYGSSTTELPTTTIHNIIHTAVTPTRTIPVVNQPLQALVLIVILISALLTNGLVIMNISRDSLKLRMVHFLLIRHVCITDSVGALFVLPIPLISFIKGYWPWGETACTVISTTTACCWTMHLVAVALYRADRVFAVWLPTGKYPVLTPRIVNCLLILVWATALSGSYLATYTFTPTFQPALALCIPNVPLIFFILVFSCYCVGLITLTTGYVFVFVRKRQKKRIEKKSVQDCERTNNSTLPAPDCLNNNSRFVLMMQENNKGRRAVVFNSPSTPIAGSSVQAVRALTPPFISPRALVQTHRRVHSDDPCLHFTSRSHESVVSVQYKSMDEEESSNECVHAPEDSVAERLDECDVSGVISSNNSDKAATPPIVPRKKNPRWRVFASYSVSIGHLILYLPAMLVIGVLGGNLPPGVAFMCGVVVYCEFIVQPIALLLVSPKLRNEVVTNLKRSLKFRFARQPDETLPPRITVLDKDTCSVNST
ncbi:unnamed protein product [Orchesella dallaii]|uniref:G-protein coupled receptors family 1 profile domain-containing protein n=1 Tax=Orchesella dallaii TaxID=48710 RepID=A0ABP1PKG7_9HEXA